MTRFFRRPPAGVLIALAAVVLSVAGSATAASVITGKQIKNSSITNKDIKNRSLLAKDFKKGQLKRGKQGPQGTRGPQGLRGVQGLPGSARAYGTVAPSGALSRSKGASVRRPVDSGTGTIAPGHYCITVAGVPNSGPSATIIAVPLAGATYYGSAAGSIGDRPIVEANTDQGLCNPGEFEVITGFTDYDAGMVDSQEQSDQAFAFLVP